MFAEKNTFYTIKNHISPSFFLEKEIAK